MQSNDKALTEEEDYDIVPEIAEGIVQELIKTARMLLRTGLWNNQIGVP